MSIKVYKVSAKIVLNNVLSCNIICKVNAQSITL